MYPKSIFLMLACTCTWFANAQEKLANYAFGQPGTDNYEHFSFWVYKGGRAAIEYQYGKQRTTVPVTFAGNRKVNGRPTFNVRFPNKLVLNVRAQGENLLVTGKHNYQKLFTWEYEGPSNGIGTFCQPCTENATKAMNLLKQYYFK